MDRTGEKENNKITWEIRDKILGDEKQSVNEKQEDNEGERAMDDDNGNTIMER